MSTTLDINTPQGAVDYVVEAAVTTPGRDRWEQVGEPTIDYTEASEIALDQARLGWTVRVIERHIVLSPITVLALHRKRLDDEAAERKAAETAADEARRKEQDDNAWSLEHGATNGQHFGLVGPGSGAWASCPRCNRLATASVRCDHTICRGKNDLQDLACSRFAGHTGNHLHTRGLGWCSTRYAHLSGDNGVKGGHLFERTAQ